MLGQTPRLPLLFLVRLMIVMVILSGPSVVLADDNVLAWEANSLPELGGWTQGSIFCKPDRESVDGWYFQYLDMNSCPNEPVGESEYFRGDLTSFIGAPAFFVEWRVEGEGPRSELVGGGATSMSVGNFFGIHYIFFVARDQAKLNRDNLLPIVFVDIEPALAHTHRLELYGDEWYIWFIDGQVVDSGIPEGAFPSFDARITWGGSSWHEPTVNRWDFIRYGIIAEDASGDSDSDGDHDLRDFYFLHECIVGVDRPVMAGGGVDPGCLWADMNEDQVVDLLDYGEFQILASGSPD